MSVKSDPVTEIAKAVLALTYGDLLEMAETLEGAGEFGFNPADLAGHLHAWAENRADAFAGDGK